MVVGFSAPALTLEGGKGAGVSRAWESIYQSDRAMESSRRTAPHHHSTAGDAADQLAAKLGGSATSLSLAVPATPEAEQGRALAVSLEAGSPRTIACLAAVASASLQSSDPPTPHAPGTTASSSAGSGSQQQAQQQQPGAGLRGAGHGSHASSGLSPVGSASDLLGAPQEQPPLEVDLEFLCDRLKQGPLTGQVVAWGWDQAARLSCVRRTMPNQLFSSLWAATEASLTKMTAQDVVEILESWLTILQQCSRHFRLALQIVHTMATYTLPAAVKRMDERQLAHVACLCRDMALLRLESDLSASSIRRGAGGGASGSSPRDLMQPVFGLIAAEAAWRVNNPARYVSPGTVSTILEASKAWRWVLVRQRDSQQLGALKEATAAALALLRVQQAQQQQQEAEDSAAASGAGL